MYTCPLHPDAAAFVNGGAEFPNTTGEVLFYQADSAVLVAANISNLPQTPSGFFAFHIHEGDSCSSEAFSSAKGHYNPTDTLHPNHAGDLPPLLFCAGRAHLSFLTDRFDLRDVIGRTVVIHSDPDDFHTQPAGNAGTKIACGLIRRT